MPKTYKDRVCVECGSTYSGRGAKFCGHSCRASFSNRLNNPAKSQQAREKISAARQGKPTTTGREIPQSQRDNIAKALKGRQLTDEHKANIGTGSKAAGCIPPRNAHLIGPAHPNWSGGHSKARQADSTNPIYIAFRQSVLVRDNWTCCDCGAKGVRLEVHHIKPWGPHPELRYDPSNGVTLCRPCHKSCHRGVRRPITVGPRTLAELRSGQSES